MGLDSYVIKVKEEDIINDFEVKMSDDMWMKRNEIAYWRKNFELHDWMQKLYRKRGGTGVFNAKFLRIRLQDIDSLENDIKKGAIKSHYSNFINTVRTIISGGDGVYYFPNW